MLNVRKYTPGVFCRVFCPEISGFANPQPRINWVNTDTLIGRLRLGLRVRLRKRQGVERGQKACWASVSGVNVMFVIILARAGLVEPRPTSGQALSTSWVRGERRPIARPQAFGSGSTLIPPCPYLYNRQESPELKRERRIVPPV